MFAAMVELRRRRVVAWSGKIGVALGVNQGTELFSGGWSVKILVMSRVEQLEDEIKAFLPNGFQELRAWLDEYDSQLWDEQLNADVLAGKLDAIADRALKDFSEGRSAEL